MRNTLRVIVGLAAVLSSGCLGLDFLKNLTNPTPTPTLQDLNGSWASVSSVTPRVDTCTAFRWTVTDLTSGTASGTFTATCFVTMPISGTATGTLSGTTVNWTATATGAGTGGAACPVTLAGTATFDGTQIRVPYTGTTCQGPVTGTEILRKN